MQRITLAIFVACLSPFLAECRAQPKADDIHVILRADLFEVDDAFYKKVAKAGRLSRADLEELERQALNAPKDKQPEAAGLFARLEKQKPLLAGKEIKLNPDDEGELLALRKTLSFLPSLEQWQKRQKGPQTIQEGVALRAHVQVSADRRFVRVKFMEKGVEIEGSEKVGIPGEKDRDAVAEIVFLKEGWLSQVRDLPDGGSFLLPLQYRPRTARENERWLVVRVVPRIVIEAEERVRRGLAP